MGSSGASTGGGTATNLYPIIRLKDGYSGNPGCAFDGSDERAKAQAIIDAAPAGSVVEFHPGTLGLGGTLKLKAQITYRGTTVFGCVVKLLSSASGATAVVAAEGWTTAQNPAYTGNPVVVERLYIDGNKAQTAGANPGCHGLVLMNWQSTVRAVNVINTPGDGIRLADRTAAGVNLTNTSVENRIEDCRIETPDGDGIHVEDYAGRLTDGYCVNNIVNSANGHAIRIKRGAGWHIAGNHVYTGGGRGQSALWVSAGFATKITGTYIDYYGQYYSGSAGYYFGIRLDQLTGRGSIISDNIIAAPSGLDSRNTYRHVHIETGSSSTGALVQLRGTEIQGQGLSSEYGRYLYVPSGSNLTVSEYGTTIRGVTAGNLLVTSGTGTLTHTVA